MRIRPLLAFSGVALGLSVLPFTGLSHARPPAPTAEVLTIGHRGAPDRAPENTLASIDAAHRLGVQWVENDVQRTEDGRLIVMHDATLRRTTNAASVHPRRSPWRISDFTLAEIERLDAGSWFSPRFAGERVPTLDAYLRRLDHNHQSLLLEIKNPQLYPGIAQQIAARLTADGWTDPGHLRNRLMVQSFGAGALRDFHRACPGARTGLLGAPPVGQLKRYAAYVDSVNPDASHLTRAYVAAVHAVKGDHGTPLRVFPWTVDSPAKAVALARLGVAGVITDRPDVIRTALADLADGTSRRTARAGH